jgi:hypothetical protein
MKQPPPFQHARLKRGEAVSVFKGEPPTRYFLDTKTGVGHYVRGLSKAELAWHQSRSPQPVTGSAFALDPTAIHECDDVVAQLQKEEDDAPPRDRL